MKDWSDRIQNIKLLAKVYGWVEVQHDEHSNMLGFTRKGKRMNVYYSKMTVSTALDHPTQGKTQLFRKNVSMRLLELLFNNPRLHTDKGYQKKRDSNFTRWF